MHADVKEIGNGLRDALMSTFSAVGAEVNSRTKSAGASAEGPQDTVGDSSSDNDAGSGDEGDGGDS